MSDDNIMNQQQVAQAFRVDRTTVRAWTKRGLPFIQGDQGKENQYYSGLTMWWVLGDEFARNDGLEELSAIQKIIYARCMATEIHRKDGICTDEDMASEEIMIGMLSVIGVDPVDVVRDVSFVKGLISGRGQGKQRKRKRKKI
ncbi:terminase small subunit [Salmonella enterica subsp. enterica]|nr:terminase small subunit [Salmonella enterica subsp. enterica]